MSPRSLGPQTHRSLQPASLAGGGSGAHGGHHDDHGAKKARSTRTPGDVSPADHRSPNGATRPPFRQDDTDGTAHHRGVGARNRTARREGSHRMVAFDDATLPVTTGEEAARIVTWYRDRWRMERLHFTLKTGGSQVEDLP